MSHVLRGLLILAILTGCATDVIRAPGENSLEPYHNCNKTAGYYKQVGDAKVAFAMTSSKLDSTFDFARFDWLIDGPSQLSVRFSDSSPKLIFKVDDSGVTENHEIKFELKQVSEEVEKKRVKEGGEAVFGPTRTEKPPIVDGTPAKGFLRVGFDASTYLKTKEFKKVEVQVPPFEINGHQVRIEPLHFEWRRKYLVGKGLDHCSGFNLVPKSWD